MKSESESYLKKKRIIFSVVAIIITLALFAPISIIISNVTPGLSPVDKTALGERILSATSKAATLMFDSQNNESLSTVKKSMWLHLFSMAILTTVVFYYKIKGRYVIPFFPIIAFLPLIYAHNQNFNGFTEIYMGIVLIHIPSFIILKVTRNSIHRLLNVLQSRSNVRFENFSKNSKAIFREKIRKNRFEEYLGMTELVYKNKVMFLRNNAINGFNKYLNISENLRVETEKLFHNYEDKLYIDLFNSEKTCVYYIDEIESLIANYYNDVRHFNNMVKTVCDIKPVEVTEGITTGTDFDSFYIFRSNLLDFLKYKVQRDLDYQMLKSQVTVENATIYQMNNVIKEAEQQTLLIEQQAATANRLAIEAAKNQEKIAEEIRDSHLRTEENTKERLNDSRHEQEKQGRHIQEIQVELEKVYKRKY